MPPVRGRKRSIARHFYLELTFSRPDIEPSDFSVNSFAWDDAEISNSESGNSISVDSQSMSRSRSSTIAENSKVTTEDTISSLASSSKISAYTRSHDQLLTRKKRIKIDTGDNQFFSEPVVDMKSDLIPNPISEEYLLGKIENEAPGKPAISTIPAHPNIDFMNYTTSTSNQRNIIESENIISTNHISGYEQQQQNLSIASNSSEMNQRHFHQRQYQQHPNAWTRDARNLSNIDLNNLENFNDPTILYSLPDEISSEIQNSQLTSSSNLSQQSGHFHEKFIDRSVTRSVSKQFLPSQVSSTSVPLPSGSTSQRNSKSTTFFYCLLCKHIYSSNNRNNNMNRHFYDNHLKSQGERLREYLLDLADELKQKDHNDKLDQ